MTWSDKLKEWAGIIVGALMVIGGLFGIWLCPEGIGRSVSEAIFVAGSLTITVDPFLKRKLLREASKDIFHHLLGFDLPTEIRSTLKEFLLGTKSYREDTEIEARAELKDKIVLLTVSVRSKVIAASDVKYRPYVAFEQSEHPRLLQVSVTANNPKLNSNLTMGDLVLSAKSDEPMVIEWKGREIKLHKGDSISTYVRFSIEGMHEDFWVYFFGAPAIYPKVRLSASPELDVSASLADQMNGNEYLYKKVFVTGDHIQIRWKPKQPLS
jgi:hypothetical protein